MGRVSPARDARQRGGEGGGGGWWRADIRRSPSQSRSSKVHYSSLSDGKSVKAEESEKVWGVKSERGWQEGGFARGKIVHKTGDYKTVHQFYKGLNCASMG